MVFVTRPISIAFTSLAVVSVLWNIYSRVSFSGGGSCRLALSDNHANYWLLKEKIKRLDSDVNKLKQLKGPLDFKQKFAANKADKGAANNDLLDKIAELVKKNKELSDFVENYPVRLSELKGSGEDNRQAVEYLYKETGELKEKLNELKTRLNGILNSIKSS